MQSPAAPLDAPSSPFDLSASQRSRALVALVVVLVLLIGAGLALDRVTTQTVVVPGAAIPAAVPFPREVRDDFARTMPGGLGRAATGQRWGTIKGAWSSGEGAARVVTPEPAAPSYALIRAGRGAGSVAMTASHVTEGMGLAFRCEDELNCWTLTARTEFGTWQLTKITAATVIDQQNVGTVPVADGTRLRVELRPEGFDIYVNDIAVRHVDSTELNDASRAGLVLGAGADPAARYSAFRSVQYDVLGPDAPIRDDFNRAGTTTLGTTTTGQQWRVESGSWRILRGEAVLDSKPSLKPSIATIDVGRTSGWVQATASTLPTGAGFVFRYRDADNYFRVSAVPAYATLNVIRVVDGVETRVGSTGVTNFGAGSTLGVRLRGQRMTFFVDGFETVTFRAPELVDAHRAGLLTDSPKAIGVRFAGFAAGPLDVAGTP
jgi:hypothetical protein